MHIPVLRTLHEVVHFLLVLRFVSIPALPGVPTEDVFLPRPSDMLQDGFMFTIGDVEYLCHKVEKPQPPEGLGPEGYATA